MGGIRVVVNIAVKDGGGILANSGANEFLTTEVIFNEVSYAIDNTRNSNEGISILRVCYEVIPVDNGELL